MNHDDGGLRIEGFPDAVRVIALEGPRATRLAHLALHLDDLRFADQCLNLINEAPEDPPEWRECLWRSAVTHFMKCFGRSKVRTQLDARRILKDDPEVALGVFEYFRALRNKHFVHDENPLSQCLPGALINDGSKSYKIEKVVAFHARGVTLSQVNYSNLKLLINRALEWVDSEYDLVARQLTEQLEEQTIEDLLARTPLQYQVPATAESVAHTRDT